MNLRIATWNINSLRLRLPLLKELIAALLPDVVCLQETKVPDELFPADGPAQLGFPHVLFRGMKGYNGVAILSRLPILLHDIAPNWCSKGDCRHIGVLLDAKGGPVELHNFYVPAGGDIPDRAQNVKYGHKLDFIAETRNWFAARSGLSRCVLVGDLNIAPLEHDVWSHKQLLKIVSHTPQETERFEKMIKAGAWVDVMRNHVPSTDKLYTWWSYRSANWELANKGRRLDHVFVTPKLAKKANKLTVLKEARAWTQPSDHVPVMVDFS